MEKREFGFSLRNLRKQAGLSQRELAGRVGIDVSYLSKIENGVMSPPSQEVILRLAEVLDADRDELLTLAGRVPFDIAQILKNLDVLQSLREGSPEKKPGSVSKMDTFGKRLRELREASGLSQSELAEKIGVSFTYLSKIETGVKPPPSEKVILKLADVLNCDKDILMASAGKVPSDIARILKNREVRQSLRESQAGRAKIGAFGKRKGFSMAKQLMNGRSLARVALAFILVLAMAVSLWFSSPSEEVKALTIDITNPAGGTLAAGTVGTTYNFKLKINVDNGELLPVNNINLAIYNSANATGYRATLLGLPLINGGKDYTNVQTGGGVANVTAVTSGFVFRKALSGNATIVWQGLPYTFPTAYGYGAITGNATITYDVLWTPPSGWPDGNYNIEADITNNSNTFTQAGGFALLTEMLAETGISQGLSTNAAGVAVVNVKINRIKYRTDDLTAIIPGGVGSYSAMVSSNPSNAIQFLTVYGVPPFNGPSFNATSGVFSVPVVGSPGQPNNSTVAEVAPMLTGNATTSVVLTVAFQAIGAAGQAGINVPEVLPNSITLRRGDADNNGAVSVVDSLAIKQYLVAQLTLSQINPLNAGSPVHDGTGGDKISVVDALAVEQFLVSQLNAYYQ